MSTSIIPLVLGVIGIAAIGYFMSTGGGVNLFGGGQPQTQIASIPKSKLEPIPVLPKPASAVTIPGEPTWKNRVANAYIGKPVQTHIDYNPATPGLGHAYGRTKQGAWGAGLGKSNRISNAFAATGAATGNYISTARNPMYDTNHIYSIIGDIY